MQIEYRVIGTGETGNLTLDDGSGEHAGYSETDLWTTEQGIVEL